MQAFVQAAQIGEARKKSQHIYKVVAPGVYGDDFFFGHACALCHICQVGAEFSSVAHGDGDNLAHAQISFFHIAQLASQFRGKLIERNDQGVVVHHKRAKRRH